MYGEKKILSHSDMPEGAVGFIYIIEYTDGFLYVGKKLTRSLQKLKPTKAQIAKRKNYVRKEWKNRPFVKYEGSSEFTSEHDLAAKHILKFCFSKKELGYEEEKIMYKLDVLEDNVYLNKSIRGVYFKGEFDVH